MKRFGLIFLCVLLCTMPILEGAMAEISLPFGLQFGMNLEEIKALLPEKGGKYEDYGDGSSYFYYPQLESMIGTMTAENATFTLTINNSAREAQLDNVTVTFSIEDNVIASFRKVLAAFTAAYGKPESDPFADIDSYVEYGTLAAGWSTDDMRIRLNLTRMYGDEISAYFVRRKCFDENDLHE